MDGTLISLTSLEMDTGGRFAFDMNNLFRITCTPFDFEDFEGDINNRFRIMNNRLKITCVWVEVFEGAKVCGSGFQL